MNKNKKLIKNTFIYFIGTILSKIMVFLMLPIYTSKLTTYEFGYIDLITTILSVLVPILTICMFDAIYRFILENNDEKESYITVGILVLFIGSIIAIIGYLILNYFYDIKYGILILLSLISNLMIGLWQSIARACKRNIVFSISGVINTVILMSMNILLILKLNFNGDALLISTMLANIVSIIFIEIKIKVMCKFNFKYFDKKILMDLMKYSIPLVPNTINWWIMSLSDRTIISKFMGVSYNGIYAVANKFPSIINIFNSVFYMSWQDVYLNDYKNLDSDKYYNNMFNKYIKAQIYLTLVLILITKLAVMILLGKDYQSAYLYIPYLYIAGVFNSLSGFIGTIYQAHKNTKAITYTSILGAILNIIINVIFIPKIGLYAAALSTMISFFVMFFIRIIDVKKYIVLKLDRKSVV